MAHVEETKIIKLYTSLCITNITQVALLVE